MGRNKGVLLLAIYFFLAIYLLPMFPHGGSDNEITRWATAASLVEKGSFEISWTEPLIGKNVDTASVNGHVYSNKAPGTAILAAPFYALTRLFVGPPDASNIRVSWFVMRFMLSSLPLLLLGVWLFQKDGDEFALAACLFATPLFVYSLLLFSHVLVGILIYFAFRLVYDHRVMTPASCLLAGALCGLAVVCEFPALVPVVVLAAGILFADKRDRVGAVSRFVIGGAPFAILLLLYNSSLFGSPFSTSYAYETFPEWAEVAGHGIFGIGLPSLSNAYLLLASPSRGLFFASPILLLSVVCFFTSPQRPALRHRVKIAAIVATTVFICGHGAAHGGWSFSARYLVLVVPLMLDSIFDQETYDFSNLWQGVLFAVSIIFCTLPALTFPFAPPEFGVPQNDFWARMLAFEGWYTPNLANVFGVAGSVWTLLPVVMSLLMVVGIVATSMRRRRRFAIGLLTGASVCAVIVCLPGLDSTEDAFRRATIAERYFKPAGRLEPVKEDAMRNNNWNALRRVNEAEWNIADVRANAPDDFPYLPKRPLEPSPSAIIRSAIALQQKGDTTSAENLLLQAKQRFEFARCACSANLAVIYYTSGRKEQAMSELESAMPQVNRASRPDCVRAQFLLGTLYREMSRMADADRVLGEFLANSEGTTDPEIAALRRQLGK